jgi:hypothetical protein
MNEVFGYYKAYFRELNITVFFGCFFFAAMLVFTNYYFRLEPEILAGIDSHSLKFLAFFLLYCFVFSIPYLLTAIISDRGLLWKKQLWLLIIVAAAIFAIKVNFSPGYIFFINNVDGNAGRYLAVVTNLPSRLLVLIICLFIVWKLGNYPAPIFGATIRNVKWKPYVIMLLIMVPLIAWASTQPDFLRIYPKMKALAFLGGEAEPWQRLLYELAYGVDFISIEMFFRGFLVLGFVRYAGPQVILPMAVFYCTIHFGKPLMECISSFFGGIVLGVVVYRTKSIAGGLVVHLGIAWMMELGGYLGHLAH